MKSKIYLKLYFLVLFFIPKVLFGQFSFVEVPFYPAVTSFDCSIYPVNYARISNGDVNNDGHDDILVSGDGDINEYSIQLYLNDGSGNLINSGMSFPGAIVGNDNRIIDLNGDGYNDLVLSAGDIWIYLSDGLGGFLEPTIGMFNVIYNAVLDFADVDADGDPDIILQGRDQNLDYLTELYINDGLANFAPASSTFLSLLNGSVVFFEFDNDGDQDLFFVGANSSGQRLMKCYLNDGTGAFSALPIPDETGAILTSAEVVDFNNDGFDEVLVIGQGQVFFETCILKNDGSGNCIRETVDLPSLSEGGINISDVDNDGDMDILLNGKWGLNPYTELFKNDGTGTFVRATNTPFKHIFRGEVKFLDIDNDGDEDAVLVGSPENGTEYSNVYLNDGFGNYTAVSSEPYGMVEGVIRSGDIDSDGDNDVLLCGYSNEDVIRCKLFFNDGFGGFTIDPTDELDSFSGDEIVLSDLDLDGDLDLILCGNNGVEKKTQLYDNNGFGSYSPVANMPFENLGTDRVYNADIDNDGDDDLLMYNNFTNTIVKKMYVNDGAFNFTEVFNDPILDIDFARITFGDIDNDADNDAIVSGWINSVLNTKVYLNNGDGSFAESLTNSISALHLPESDFTDLDDDGDLDLYYCGNENSTFYGRFYQNDGAGNFQLIPYQPFDEFDLGKLDFHDLDLDGDEDALISGINWSGNAYCTLFQDLGIMNYVDFVADPFPDISWSRHEFNDFNGDGKPDIIITGQSGNDRVAKLFLNSTNVSFFENDSANKLRLTPNPVQESFTVSSDLNIKGKNFEIIDCWGKLVVNGRFSNDQMTINVESLFPGLYFLHVDLDYNPVIFIKH